MSTGENTPPSPRGASTGTPASCCDTHPEPVHGSSGIVTVCAAGAVQHECIPQAILGMDILCQAKSGMGKTAVFVLSVLQQIEADDKDDEATVKAVVLCHTRELAFQVRTSLLDLSLCIAWHVVLKCQRSAVEKWSALQQLGSLYRQSDRQRGKRSPQGVLADSLVYSTTMCAASIWRSGRPQADDSSMSDADLP